MLLYNVLYCIVLNSIIYGIVLYCIPSYFILSYCIVIVTIAIKRDDCNKKIRICALKMITILAILKIKFLCLSISIIILSHLTIYLFPFYRAIAL